MVGAGSAMFAVWPYVIAKMKPDKEMGAQVDLNPELLAFVLGEKPDVIQKVIDRLCQPDPKSTTPEKNGKRLIKVGQYSYQVVNGAKYMAIRNEEDRRRANRLAKRRERARRVLSPTGYAAWQEAVDRGDEAEADRILEGTLPKPKPSAPPAPEKDDETPF